MARLNLKTLTRVGALEAGTDYTLDDDNVIIEAEKADARRTYRTSYGYQPGVGMIGDKSVYVEHRYGNSEPMYRQYRTLRRLFWVLREENIKITRFRADSGSYVGSDGLPAADLPAQEVYSPLYYRPRQMDSQDPPAMAEALYPKMYPD